MEEVEEGGRWTRAGPRAVAESVHTFMARSKFWGVRSSRMRSGVVVEHGWVDGHLCLSRRHTELCGRGSLFDQLTSGQTVSPIIEKMLKDFKDAPRSVHSHGPTVLLSRCC